MAKDNTLLDHLKLLFQAHPWHGSRPAKALPRK